MSDPLRGEPETDPASDLRVLTIMNCRAEDRSGMPTANTSLSREMRALGCRVDHVYLEDFPRWVRRAPLNYPSFAPLSVLIVRRLERRLGGYDVIQVSGGDSYVAPLLRRDPGGRRRLVVGRCHGLEHRYWEAYLREVALGHESARLRHRLYFGRLRLHQVEQSIRRVDLFNCHTDEDARYVLERGWKRPDQVVILPSGIEREWLDAPLERAARGGRILFCGSWTWMKGVRVLKRVFERLAAEVPEVTLTIVGSGVDESGAVGAFPQSLRSRIVCKPDLSHRQILEEFQRHDLLLATSMFEGFGTVVIEALAGGLPVVASDVGGVGDFVHDGQGGYRVPAGDIDGFVRACRTILSTPGPDLLLLRRAGRLRVQHVTWTKVARWTRDAYRAALERVRREET